MNQISWEKYCELAARTESVPINSFELGHGYSNVITRLIHAQFGLQTEVHEYLIGTDLKNKIEELGDTYWYMAILHSVLDPYPLVELIQINTDWDIEISERMYASYWIAEMADVLKRAIFYGENLYEVNKKGILPRQRLMVCYWGVMRWLEDQHLIDGIPSAQQVFAMNIEKLAKRYPDLAFKSEDAITRDIVNELSHIPTYQTKLIATFETLGSSEGLDITNLAEAEKVFVGCDPRDVRKFLESLVFVMPIQDVEFNLGVSLKDYITSIYTTVDGKMFLKLTAKEDTSGEVGVYEQIFEPSAGVSSLLPAETDSQVEALSFSNFRRVMHENYPNFTDMLTFGGHFFLALDQYYSSQECHAVSKAYKAGFVELMAYRPSQSSSACRDIWAIIAVWGPLHVYGVPRTTVDLYKMINDTKSLCLCPSMLKK